MTTGDGRSEAVPGPSSLESSRENVQQTPSFDNAAVIFHDTREGMFSQVGTPLRVAKGDAVARNVSCGRDKAGLSVATTENSPRNPTQVAIRPPLRHRVDLRDRHGTPDFAKSSHHECRPQQGLGNVPPNGAARGEKDGMVVKAVDIVCRERLDGPLKHHERRVA